MDYKILKENDSGSDVILLQQLLKINNYFPATVTGSFGSDTTSYVKNFQQDFNLEPTGIVDEKTWEKLYEITTPTTKGIIDKPTIREGDTGEEVKEVQTVLKQLLYYEGEITGIFDSNLAVSVKTFQYVNNLVPDGIVGKDTWSALIIIYSPLSSCDITATDQTYTVQPGDTLYSIAKKLNTTVEKLKQINNLTSDTLSIGQILKIEETTEPEIPQETINYTVKAGDSLYAIAKSYNTTVDEIKKLNNLTSNILSIGQILKIPTTSPEPPIEPEIPPTTPDQTYTVQPGDTLYSIATKFNTTVDNIKQLNNLTSNTLSIGQILKITSTETPPQETTIYTVKAGDSLYKIAMMYNTSVSEIKALNNLTSDILSIGQILKVPQINQTIYTVEPGDTLYSIANKFNTTVDIIKQKNNLISNTLSIGQQLKI